MEPRTADTALLYTVVSPVLPSACLKPGLPLAWDPAQLLGQWNSLLSRQASCVRSLRLPSLRLLHPPTIPGVEWERLKGHFPLHRDKAHLRTLPKDPSSPNVVRFVSVCQPQTEFSSSYIRSNQKQEKSTSIVCFVEHKTQSNCILSTG